MYPRQVPRWSDQRPSGRVQLPHHFNCANALLAIWVSWMRSKSRTTLRLWTSIRLIPILWFAFQTPRSTCLVWNKFQCACHHPVHYWSQNMGKILLAYVYTVQARRYYCPVTEIFKLIKFKTFHFRLPQFQNPRDPFCFGKILIALGQEKYWKIATSGHKPMAKLLVVSFQY